MFENINNFEKQEILNTKEYNEHPEINLTYLQNNIDLLFSKTSKEINSFSNKWNIEWIYSKEELEEIKKWYTEKLLDLYAPYRKITVSAVMPGEIDDAPDVNLN